MWRWGAAVLCLGSSIAALAQSRPCTQEEAQRADQAVDTLNSWDRIHDWYGKFRQCDEGGQAEGVSEAVARNLVDRWETLPQLGELAKDAGFRRFVLKHIDETLNAEDLKKIGANAAKRCPADLRSLCRELKRQTEAP
jgi:hypothetical protein